MTDLLAQVTPLTKGLLWFTKGKLVREKPFYKEVDYLLNGLLTATLNTATDQNSFVLVNENFGNSFYVLAGSNISEAQIKSFFDLLKPQMSGESNLLLVDESAEYEKFQKIIPAEIRSRIQKVQ